MIRRLLLALTLFAVFVPTHSEGDVSLGPTSSLHFASPTEGRKILTTRDDFIQRLSPFDRSARMKIDRVVSTEEFLGFVEKNVVEWTPEEMQKVQEAIDKFQPALQDFGPAFPRTVFAIKTTGAEEGGAAYTRGEAIVLPKSFLTKDSRELQKLISHELFHVLSRHDPVLRDRLYQVIGFSKCAELELPPELKQRKITNPDAPRNDHYIQVKTGGNEALVVPILLSTTPVYDLKRGGEFFEYLSLKFLLVTKDKNTGRFSILIEDGKPQAVELPSVSGFFEQVGKNTQYIIHPEEILADNFAFLVLGEQNLPSPEIPRRIKEVLAEKR